MIDVNQAITIVSVILGSGLVQFLLTRKDKKQEDAKKDNADTIKKDMKDHLTEVNNKWKADYCDKNSKLIEELTRDVKLGLEQREQKGLERYQEHKEAISELREAIIALTKDAEDRRTLESYMASSLLAITHDKLVYLGKTYQKRGAITLAEKNNMKLLYTPYHDGLGGNSDGEGYYTYCMHLPVVTDEEAAEMDKKSKEELIRQLNNVN